MAPAQVPLMTWRHLVLGMVVELLLGVVVVEGKVVLEDNRYSDMVVALDPDAPTPTPSDQEKVLQDIQTLFTETSAAVFVATEERAYFGNITIVIPNSWQEALAEGEASGGESWRRAHVRVVEGEEGSTQGPHTVEGGGCGVEGARLELPRAYLTQSTVQEMYGAPGKVMAQEWLKYRYGVYEEHGYPGDEVYPHVYLDVLANETRPTGCTNHQVLQGSWVNRGGMECDPLAAGGTTGDAECRFKVDGTTSDYSLMFITHVDQVTRVCTEETHDQLAPTRHNRLCGGASVWQVMNRHPDFSGNNNINPPTDAGGEYTAPTFRVVRTITPALFVLVDDNCGKDDTVCEGLTVYNDLRGTLRDVLLQGNIQMAGIARYRILNGNSIVALYQKTVLLPVNEMDIDDFVNHLPLTENKGFVTDPEFALRNILQKLADSDYPGGVSMLLVQMVNTNEDGSSLPAHLLDTVKVTGVLYGSDTFNPWIQELTESTGGDLYFSQDYRPNVAQQALLSLLPSNKQVTVTQQEVSVEAEAEVEVYIDGTVGISTNFTVRFSNDGGNFKIISPDGNEIDVTSAPYTHMEPDAKEGLWRMVVSNAVGQGTAEVQVTSRARPQVEQVEVMTWTSAPSQGDLDLGTSNLAFYVSVTQGRKAVKGLSVKVIFYSGSSSSSRMEVGLWDDGYGDPDVQLEDGIYSGYVTDFGSQASVSQTRLYADVTITQSQPTTHARTVASHPRNTRTLPHDPFEVEPCCGSVSDSGAAVELPLARYIASVITFTTVNGPGNLPYDPPPSQVSNVVATSVEQEGPLVDAGTVLVGLKWNAPGKDLTTGTVTRYEIWYSSSLEEIMTDFESSQLVEDDQYLNGPPTPQPYGGLQEATVILPKIVNDPTRYFLVVVGVDSGQKGKPSPPVSVIVTAGVDFTTAPTTESTTTSSTSPTTESTTTSSTSPTTESTTTASTSPTTESTTTASTSPTTTASTSPTTESTTTSSTSPTTESTITASTSTTSPSTSTTSPSTTSPSNTKTSTVSITDSDSSTASANTDETDDPSSETDSSGSPATDDSITSDPTENPTESPESDFVGSVGFWVIIGVSSAAVVVVSGLIIHRIWFKNKGAQRVSPSTRGPTSKGRSGDQQSGAISNAEEGTLSVSSTTDGAADGTGDASDSITESAEPAKSSSQPMEVINEGFEGDD